MCKNLFSGIFEQKKKTIYSRYRAVFLTWGSLRSGEKHRVLRSSNVDCFKFQRKHDVEFDYKWIIPAYLLQ